MNDISTLQVVAMGLVTVFVCLICLIIIMKLLGFIVGKTAGKKTAAVPATPAVAAQPAAAVPTANSRQLVAAIATAIAEEMGTDPAHIRIHSIKRV